MAVDSTVVRDVVVAIPGIMGSALVDRDDRVVWSVSAGSLVNAIRTLGASLKGLQLPDRIGDQHPGDGVTARDLLPSLHVIPGLWSPITGYDGMLSFLRSGRFHLIEADPRDPDRIPNLITFPYDWRLSNRYNGRLLASVASAALERWQSQPGMQDAKLIFVCHSMGGLVARWFLERENGASMTRALITLGTPFRGALKALDTLSNGLKAGVGPFRLQLTNFARSLPSLHQLLPAYDCLTDGNGTRRSLRGLDIPGIGAAMLSDAMTFHSEIEGTATPAYRMHKVVGIRQPTLTTATFSGGKIIASEEIDGRNQGGDGTVPLLASQPILGRGTEVHEVADQHGVLQGTRSALDLIDGILTREDVIWQDAVSGEAFGVAMADEFSPASRPSLRVAHIGDRRLHVTVFDEAGTQVGDRVVVGADGYADVDPMPPGGYSARVSSALRGGPPPVTCPFLVWEEAVPSDLVGRRES